MYCPCSTAAIVIDTAYRQLYMCTADITALSQTVLQTGGQWEVGRILVGAALEDKRVYKQILSKWRSTAVDQGVIHQLEEVRH